MPDATEADVLVYHLSVVCGLLPSGKESPVVETRPISFEDVTSDVSPCATQNEIKSGKREASFLQTVSRLKKPRNYVEGSAIDRIKEVDTMTPKKRKSKAQNEGRAKAESGWIMLPEQPFETSASDKVRGLPAHLLSQRDGEKKEKKNCSKEKGKEHKTETIVEQLMPAFATATEDCLKPKEQQKRNKTEKDVGKKLFIAASSIPLGMNEKTNNAKPTRKDKVIIPNTVVRSMAFATAADKEEEKPINHPSTKLKRKLDQSKASPKLSHSNRRKSLPGRAASSINDSTKGATVALKSSNPTIRLMKTKEVSRSVTPLSKPSTPDARMRRALSMPVTEADVIRFHLTGSTSPAPSISQSPLTVISRVKKKKRDSTLEIPLRQNMLPKPLDLEKEGEDDVNEFKFSQLNVGKNRSISNASKAVSASDRIAPFKTLKGNKGLTINKMTSDPASEYKLSASGLPSPELKTPESPLLHMLNLKHNSFKKTKTQKRVKKEKVMGGIDMGKESTDMETQMKSISQYEATNKEVSKKDANNMSDSSKKSKQGKKFKDVDDQKDSKGERRNKNDSKKDKTSAASSRISSTPIESKSTIFAHALPKIAATPLSSKKKIRLTECDLSAKHQRAMLQTITLLYLLTSHGLAASWLTTIDLQNPDLQIEPRKMRERHRRVRVVNEYKRFSAPYLATSVQRGSN
ncbi:hypothetical protein L204_103671 [Cryptococcus depauperatus]